MYSKVISFVSASVLYIDICSRRINCREALLIVGKESGLEEYAEKPKYTLLFFIRIKEKSQTKYSQYIIQKTGQISSIWKRHYETGSSGGKLIYVLYYVFNVFCYFVVKISNYNVDGRIAGEG